MDLLWDFAYPLPVATLCSLLGIDLENMEKVKKFSLAIGQMISGPLEDISKNHQAYRRTILDCRDFLLEHIEKIRGKKITSEKEDHGISVINKLLEGNDTEVITDIELVSNLVLLLFAGHDTTTSLISNMVLTMCTNPEQMRILENNPSLLPVVVEETLRLHSPAQRINRKIIKDVEIGGVKMKEGDWITMTLGKANRDPQQFPNPHHIDLLRPKAQQRHLAFGKGRHVCLGRNLAKLEGKIAAEYFFLNPKIKNLRLVDQQQVQWFPNVDAKRLVSLPVEWD
eukprot:CAMPEP_0174254284 /NCGR_PEP_ID=MMETSP0439-20130205/3618_1 /TAXON_ID=0 /ORGANISM="Stereomyxa ramosa, Strain Chinc5" /LENGTH=282 /DNA_ID=CAMNT_0015335781 /DNA_START=466 /DNA_END=1314 /DNA_ORIENTATION=-